MGEQYRVVPQALRQAQQSIDHTADRWNEMANRTLPSWKLADGDLGLIGRAAGIVQEYNAAVEEIADKVRNGQSSFRHTADALNQVSRDYERQDAEYYEKFGWIQRDLDEVAPPPQ